MSYRRKHIRNKIHKIKPKRSILKRPIFWIGLFLFIIVSATCYILFFYPKFRIDNIMISGNQKVQTENIKSLVSNNIKKQSIFLINTAAISKEVLNNFPIINNIKIDKKLTSTLTVEISERSPVGVFCQDKCFLIDENGVIFEQIQDVPQEMFIVRQQVEESKVFIGGQVIEQNIIKAVSSLEKNLRDGFEINIKEAIVVNPSQLNIKTDENWQAYLSLDQDSDINLQITKLNLLLKGEITPEARKKLEYIDLRFKDRAYYK